ncbi:AraC family transcriptional regulator ligand-binding domain-containing protein [Marinobacter sp. NFXS9]|uniref:AraC family transcriptional regulator n=1 Tax=Marinobacter sp. NFXS9 TaxID=2818433 RepID=UPI0032E04BB8
MDTIACLANSAISTNALSEPGTTIEAWQELAVIRNLIQLGARADFGYRVGCRYHLTSLGLLGFTMLASASLDNALGLLNRFQTLALTLCPVSTEIHPQGLWFLFDERVLPPDAKSLVIERGLSGIIRIASELMQRDVHPMEVTVKHGEKKEGHPRDYWQPYSVRFKAEQNGVLFAYHDLTAPLPQANLSSRFEGERLCSRMIDELPLSASDSPIVRRVQEAVLESAPELLTARQVAERIGLSERTLHRRLAGTGKTFAIINDSVKQKMAERLLSESNIGIAEVAQQLGYSEAASFSRAFSRWTGHTPGRWRRTRH